MYFWSFYRVLKKNVELLRSIKNNFVLKNFNTVERKFAFVQQTLPLLLLLHNPSFIESTNYILCEINGCKLSVWEISINAYIFCTYHLLLFASLWILWRFSPTERAILPIDTSDGRCFCSLQLHFSFSHSFLQINGLCSSTSVSFSFSLWSKPKSAQQKKNKQTWVMVSTGRIWCVIKTSG